MWPFCRQPLYARSMPLMFNATVLNGMGLTGRFEAPPVWTPTDAGGGLLDVRFEFSGAQLSRPPWACPAGCAAPGRAPTRRAPRPLAQTTSGPGPATSPCSSG